MNKTRLKFKGMRDVDKPQKSKDSRSDRVINRYLTLTTSSAFASSIIVVIYPIFLRSHGLTQLQANSILAISFIIVFLTDIPTGAIADVLGRRFAFVVGNIVRAAGWGIYSTTTTFQSFIGAESLSAIGFTFGNGTLEAWVVDSLDKEGFTEDKTLVFSRVSQLAGAAAIFGAVIGAYAAGFSMAAPWALGAVALLIIAGASIQLMAGERVTAVSGDLGSQIRKRLSTGLARGLTNRSVLLLGMAMFVQAGAWAPYEMEWQRYFVDAFGSGIGTVGWIFCLFRVSTVLGASAWVRIRPQRHRRSVTVAALWGGCGILLIVAGRLTEYPWVVLAALCFAYSLLGAASPVFRAWANEEIGSQHRATLLSFFSTFGTFGGAVGLLVGGRLVDEVGLGKAWQVGGLLFLVCVPISLAASSYHRRNVEPAKKHTVG